MGGRRSGVRRSGRPTRDPPRRSTWVARRRGEPYAVPDLAADSEPGPAPGSRVRAGRQQDFDRAGRVLDHDPPTRGVEQGPPSRHRRLDHDLADQPGAAPGRSRWRLDGRANRVGPVEPRRRGRRTAAAAGQGRCGRATQTSIPVERSLMRGSLAGDADDEIRRLRLQDVVVTRWRRPPGRSSASRPPARTGTSGRHSADRVGLAGSARGS